MLLERARAGDALPYPSVQARAAAVRPWPEPVGLLEARERALVLVGGGAVEHRCARRADRLVRSEHRTSAPQQVGAARTMSTTRRTVPRASGTSGSPTRGLFQRVRDADVLLVIGERLPEITTSGYTRLLGGVPTHLVIHVQCRSTMSTQTWIPANVRDQRRSGCVRGCVVAPAHARGTGWAWRAELEQGRADVLFRQPRAPAPARQIET